MIDSLYLDSLVQFYSNNTNNYSLPIGVIHIYAGSNTPTGWMICDGSEVSRTQYSDLFSKIGEIYGSGDGISTFNIPDLRGRIPVGKDDMGGTSSFRVSNGDVLGNSGGSENHTLTIDEMPSHSHSMTTISGGGHTDAGSGAYTDYSTFSEQQTSTVGGDQPHNIMQPYLITNYIIKVSGSTSNSVNNDNSEVDNSTNNNSNNDTIYEYNINYSVSNNNYGDTLIIPFIDGKDLFITGSFNHTQTSTNDVKLKILNDGEQSIYAKTNGFKHYRASGSSTINTYSHGIYDYEVISINYKQTKFNMIVRPIGEITNYVKVYLEFTDLSSTSVNGSVKILY